MSELTFGSLFSGIGGFDLAFERAGMRCLWQAENDPKASALLARHWPNVKNYGDVRNVKKGSAPAVDVICGGFPCQDLSVAGKRAGLAGERSGLWFEFARVIDEFEPRIVLIENVPGLLSSDGGRDFAIILRWLVQRGYGVAWRVLDAQYFGVAQRRRRVFIVGSIAHRERSVGEENILNNTRISGLAAEILFERESLQGDIESLRAKRKVAPSLSASGVGAGRTGNERTEAEFVIPVAKPLGAHHVRRDLDNESYVLQSTYGALQERDGKGIGTTIDDKIIAFTADGDGSDAGQDVAPTLEHGASEKSGHGSYKKKAVAFTQNTRDEVRQINGDGDLVGALAAEPGAKQQNYIAQDIVGPLMANAATENKHGDGGISSLDQYLSGHIQPTVWKERAGGGNGGKGFLGKEDQAFSVNGYVQRIGVRRLTPVECERLQGFPDGYTEGQADSVRYRQLGNAVAVPVVEWIAKRIVKVMKAG